MDEGTMAKVLSVAEGLRRVKDLHKEKYFRETIKKSPEYQSANKGMTDQIMKQLGVGMPTGPGFMNLTDAVTPTV